MLEQDDTSAILEMEDGEIENEYDAYWKVVKEDKVSKFLVANAIRNILECFLGFVQKQKLGDLFKDKRYKKCKSIHRFINRESRFDGVNQYDYKEFDVNVFKKELQELFKELNHEAHYNNYMGSSQEK